MDYLERLKSIAAFCMQHDRIFIYGAGEYAQWLTWYLGEEKQSIAGYIVSDGEYIGKPSIDGVAVCHLSEAEFSDGDGIFVALSEKWQRKVCDALLAKGIHSTVLYCIGDPLFVVLQTWCAVVCNRREERFSESETSCYEANFHAILGGHQHIEVRRGFGYSIGGALLELFCQKKYDTAEHAYTLYVVATKEDPRENYFLQPNAYFYNVFDDKNFCCVREDNLKFWKYIFLHHPEKLAVHTDYGYVTDVMEKSIERMHQGNFRNTEDGFIRLEKDEKSGRVALEKMGVHGDFIAIYARDDGYYKKTWCAPSDEDLRVMDFYRNSDIRTFLSAAEFLKDRGIASVRVGSFPASTLQVDAIVDYAKDFHSDFMDFYLAKHCKFFLGDHSGVIFFQVFWSKPMVMINLPNITGYADGSFPFVRERDLAIYHKFWSKEKNRLLNLSEILEIEDLSDQPYTYSGNVRVMEEYDKCGIVPIPNTPEEIRAVTQEMLERLDGKLSYTEEDEMLQSKFWAILEPYLKTRPRVLWYDARVGRDFLRENPWMTC